ncbi:DUF2946 domain-containing protein [Vibrio spartinae]|uniref:DUF2946 domain-containing protein n=1 Tax=Vibrio spartinae TaxID=1918945 RepID=A0ABX6R0F0_9VIBR|nr:DUF2946 domain-containing protein [Vibrio spartinae]QMV14988.1 hypothetical protein Vspart_02266 [Vibrio spartinae]
MFNCIRTHSRFTYRSWLKLKWQQSMAWCGLFAMLMIYIAPLVSQTMVMSQAGVHSPTMMMHESAPHHPNRQTTEHHATHPTTVTHQDAHALHHAWCGYCSLLLHMSAITYAPLQLASHRAVLEWLRVTMQPFLLRAEWRKKQLPRAPPPALFSLIHQH